MKIGARGYRIAPISVPKIIGNFAKFSADFLRIGKAKHRKIGKFIRANGLNSLNKKFNRNS